MKHSGDNFICRVCGLASDVPLWLADNDPTYIICDCCGVEAGNEDTSYESVLAYRQHWLESGANWFAPNYQPEHWNLEDQLKQVPKEWK